MLSASCMKKIGLFVGGVFLGTAGVKVLSSKDAKKAYVHCTAAALRAKNSVMKTVSTVQENAEDILAEAKQINDDRIAAENTAVVEDEAECCDVCAESEEAKEMCIRDSSYTDYSPGSSYCLHKFQFVLSKRRAKYSRKL